MLLTVMTARSTTVLIIKLDSRFVLKVSSVKNLVENEALEELYLTGNPCCQVPITKKSPENMKL